MDIEKRITEISDYFVTFNVADGYAYVVAKFPDKWTIPDTDSFKVSVSTYDDGTKCFYGDFNDGIENIFDAVSFTIETNLIIQEKSNLLIEYGKKLTEIFSEYKIEKLRTLRFVFDDDHESKKPKKTKTKTSGKGKKKETTDKPEIEDGKPNGNETLLEYAIKEEVEK